MPDQPAERWIFCFKWSGTRSLTEDEKRDLLARSRRLSNMKYLRGLFAVLLAVGAVAGIIFAAHGNPFGWVVLIAGTIAFMWALSWAGSGEMLALLYRRAARVGEVDRYDRQAPANAGRVRFRKPDPFGDGEDEVFGYWQEEEKFLELMDECAGQKVEYFETPASDGVLVFVEGRVIERIVNVDVQPVEA